MKKILITNDDGINAAGIRALAEELGKTCEVYVVAPASQQSAKSQSITFLREVRVCEEELPGAYSAVSLDGTPADCVMWAIPYYAAKGIRFDYLFAGINMGSNTGLAAYYSGTVAAAREGTLNGVKSVALSVASHEAVNFAYICGMAPKLMEMADSLGPGTFLNVNAPDIPVWEMKGTRIVPVAPWGYKEKYTFSETSPGMYQMGIEKLTGRGEPERSFSGRGVRDADLRYDYDCIRHGYASISPLTAGCADQVALRRLEGLWPEEDTLIVVLNAQDEAVSLASAGDEFSDKIYRFVKCAVRLDMPLVFAEQYGMGRMMDSVCEAAAGSRAETVVRKEFSAWDSLAFTNLVERSSARKIMIAGLETHTAVMQTAADMAGEGYEVTVVEDCCISADRHDHEVAIDRMRDAGCWVVTLSAAVMELMHHTGHPAANSIMNILRNN